MRAPRRGTTAFLPDMHGLHMKLCSAIQATRPGVRRLRGDRVALQSGFIYGEELAHVLLCISVLYIVPARGGEFLSSSTVEPGFSIEDGVGTSGERVLHAISGA